MYTRKCYRHNCCSNSTHNNDNSCEYETLCDNIPMVTSCCNDNQECNCGYDTDNCCGDIFPAHPMYSQSYVPIQNMDRTYIPCIGLQKGTIFPELVDPYYPCQSMDFINFIKKTNVIGEGCNR